MEYSCHMTVEKLSTARSGGLPSLNALRAFEVAGRHLNFRKAADELHVTPGAVSQHIRKLEAEIGTDLFLRDPEGLAFTPAGRAYHRQLVDIFENLREATAELRPARGAVTISVTPTVASKWLIPRLPEFAELHPDVDVRVVATERVLSFHTDLLDLAIRQSASRFGSGVTAQPLFQQELIAVCAPALVADRVLPLSDKDIKELPLLHDSGDFWPEFLSEPRRDSVAGLRLGATGLCLDAAVAGQGIALASRFLVQRELSDGRLVQVTPRSLLGPEIFYLLRRRHAPASAPVEALQGWLCTHAQMSVLR